jgi:hypothetical protein
MADWNSELLKHFQSDNRFEIILPTDPPDVVISKISACKMIFSSSLHGLIVADSYSIPNYWIKLSDRLTGGDYKFKDYYSAIGKPPVQADLEQIFNDEYLESLYESWTPIRNLKRIQQNLIGAFPF